MSNDLGDAGIAVWRFSDTVVDGQACTPNIEAFWQEYCQARSVSAQTYDVCRMGSDAAMADELLALILTGQKRASACLLRDVETGTEVMAQVGGFVVVLDGSDRACAIWRTRTVDVKSLNQIDDAFAWDEGEGERTREDWLALHVRYFAERSQKEGFAFDASMKAVFGRFTPVWPPSVADPEGR